MNKNDKVALELAREKAKRDASYEYGPESKEPVAKGAFNGALASGLASRIIKPKGRLGELAVVGAGTISGAIAGKKYNEEKVRLANNARKWLADRRKSKKYAEFNKKLYKTSENIFDPNSINSAKTAALNSAVGKVHPEEKGEISLKEMVKDALIGGGLGALLYGGFSALKNPRALTRIIGRKNALSSAGKGAALFGATAPTGDIATNIYEGAGGSKNEYAGTFAAYGAGAGALEPLVLRTYGRYMATPKAIRSANRSIRSASPYSEVSESRNIMQGFKSRGSKSQFFKNIFPASMKSISRGALGGLAAGYLIDKLISKNKPISKNQPLKKTSSIVIPIDDAVRAKEYSAKKILRDSSLKTDAAIAAGSIVGGALAGRLFGFKHSGKLGAALASGYGGYRIIKNEIDRHNARRFLNLPRAGKIHEIKKEHDSNVIPTEEVLETYTGMKVIDRLFNNK